MQQVAAGAYAKVAKATQSPRDLEATLLLKAAYRLQAVADGWADGQADLDGALAFNRRIWTILATSATEPENPLPPALKQSVAQLAAVIFQRTLDLVMEPAPERLGLLVRINRDIAGGLRGSGEAPPRAAA